jgi:hypothetical protein
MRLLTPILWLSAFTAAMGDITAPPADLKNLDDQSRESTMDRLLSVRDSNQALDAAVDAARKNHISEQAILEARFLYHIDRHEDDAIAAMLPEFLKQREVFKIEDSAIFSIKEDWLAVTEYVQAIASLKKGDKAGFKNHITEAFWLSPRQASAFAPHIDRMRLEENMRQVAIDFGTTLLPLVGNEAVTLQKLMVGKKAMLFHFWSPASRECESSLPDYAVTAKALDEKGIAMISILSSDSPEILTNARKMIQPLGTNFPGAWLVDRKDKSFAQDLRIQALPTFVLITGEGRILFNGDPTEDGLWDALKKIDPLIIRPQAAKVTE